jgi:hypothetical protein
MVSVAFAGIVGSGSVSYTKSIGPKGIGAGGKSLRAFIIIAAVALLALIVGFFFFGSANLGH